MKQTERAWHRRQNVGRGQRNMLLISSVTAAVVILVLLAVGCQPGTQWRGPNGNVMKALSDGHMVEYAEPHIDTDPVNAWDNTCRLLGGCFPWTPPKDHHWHRHVFWDLMPGIPGVSDPFWWVHAEDWHNYLNCMVFLEMEDQWECHQWDPITITAVRG